MGNILLVGGSQGLGKDLVNELKTRGHNVTALSRSSTIPLDLSWDETSIKQSIKQALSSMDSLDSLVVSSGKGAYHWPLVSQATVEDLMKVNFIGPTTVFKACLKALLKSKGNAMFVTSTVSRKPGSGALSYYSASKGAMHSWITSESRRMASKGVSLFALSPGWFESGMTAEIKSGIKDASTRAIPFGRFGSSEEIAKFGADLLEQSNWVTAGSIYEASGGM